jgi:CRISPR-associated protein Cmr6
MPRDGLVLGPLGKFVEVVDKRFTPAERLKSANGRVLLHRTAVLDEDLVDEPVLKTAVKYNLGQGERAGTSASDLVEAIARRRQAAMNRLGSIRRVELHMWGALVTGTGTGGVRDVGIELEGTYGWPVLPGSSLKGVAREYARQHGKPSTEIFGSEPEADEHILGAVRFFDALPGPGGVEVVEHVLTPHTRGYRSAAESGSPAPPGEHINPVPIPFLAVERGAFIAYLAGPEPHLSAAADLLVRAVDELGVGAKTASGYGYLGATI